VPSIQPEDSVWLARGEFLEMDATETYRRVIEDDYKKLHDSVVDVTSFEQLADRCLTFDLYLIQGWYRAPAAWEDDPGLRLAIAMGTSAFNTLLLVRHAVKLGYHADTGPLIRQAYEYTSRCLLFPLDTEATAKFMAGETIFQAEIDKRLAALSSDIAPDAHDILRESYRDASEFSHPNLYPISIRNPLTAVPKGERHDHSLDADMAGLDTALGGITIGISVTQGLVELAMRANDLAGVLKHSFADHLSTADVESAELSQLVNSALKLVGTPRSER